MAETSRVIIESDDDKPFFLYFATSDPHRGGGKDKNSELDLAPDMFGNKQNRQAYPGVKEVFYDPADVAVPPFLPDTPETRAELAQYYQSISRIDQGVGRLIEILKDAGKWDDTLFVFTADHGMAFPGAKTNVYEPALRVPFIVRDPAVKKRGITSDAMLSFVDITPSLLDYGGGYNAKKNAPIKPDSRTLPPTTPGENRGKPYRGFHGRSFIPIIGQQHADGWDQIAASHTFHEIQMYKPHARRPRPQIQAHLEHRPRSTLPLRLRSLGSLHLAGAVEKRPRRPPTARKKSPATPSAPSSNSSTSKTTLTNQRTSPTTRNSPGSSPPTKKSSKPPRNKPATRGS